MTHPLYYGDVKTDGMHLTIVRFRISCHLQHLVSAEKKKSTNLAFKNWHSMYWDQHGEGVKGRYTGNLEPDVKTEYSRIYEDIKKLQ